MSTYLIIFVGHAPCRRQYFLVAIRDKRATDSRSRYLGAKRVKRTKSESEQGNKGDAITSTFSTPEAVCGNPENQKNTNEPALIHADWTSPDLPRTRGPPGPGGGGAVLMHHGLRPAQKPASRIGGEGVAQIEAVLAAVGFAAARHFACNHTLAQAGGVGSAVRMELPIKQYAPDDIDSSDGVDPRGFERLICANVALVGRLAGLAAASRNCRAPHVFCRKNPCRYRSNDPQQAAGSQQRICLQLWVVQ
jgi:hypothetical protein